MTDTTAALADELEAMITARRNEPWVPNTISDFTLRNSREILSVLRSEGRMREALAEHDAAVAGLPCAPGKKLAGICPRCGASARESCGPSVSADYSFVEAARQALAEPNT